MRKLFFITTLIMIAISLYGQRERQGTEDSPKKYYTLNGQRHGANFFPEVELQHVQYVAGETLSFDKYHSADVINTWLKR